jgi:dynein heavy chain, axonemal
MILKALRDFNEAKFGRADSIIVEGIIKDVFNVKTSTDATRLALRDDSIDPYYGNLKTCLEWTFSFMKLNPSPLIVEKALLLYELLKAKHGIILLGDASTGKSTLIKMLENALNKSSLNEMQVLMD